MNYKHILLITFLNEPKLILLYTVKWFQLLLCPVGWGSRIHRLLLYHASPGYGTKQSDGEVPVMLELWGMQRTPSLPLLPGPLLPRMLAPDRALSMG